MTFGGQSRLDRPSAQNYTPNRVYMSAPDHSSDECKVIARKAVAYAKGAAPKMSGRSAKRFYPTWGEGFFGIRWIDAHVWFQERGIRPFTMRNLAGRTIPMWIDDPTGEERRNNPDAETRITADGRTQVLIFRKVSQEGQRTTAWRRRGGFLQEVDVPSSYPGAPGRIALRDPQGRISPGNVGVRWRHPGMAPKGFLYEGMVLAAWDAGLEIRDVVATNERWTLPRED